MTALNETHDTGLTSWLDSANPTGNDFPIQNLPFGVFRPAETGEAFRGGVAIGDQIVDLQLLSSSDLLDGLAQEAALACSEPTLNTFMGMGSERWSALRLALSQLLRTGASQQGLMENFLVPQSLSEHALPCQIGDYTDFYASIHHATNIGRLFRPDNPLLPNYEWIPIGYHGRASSIGVSGQHFHRPIGQLKAADQTMPVVEPCKRLDYELEVGVFTGPGNELGQPVSINDAESHIFGLCLLNDWSARDIQAWEYQPLGPFLAKSFATTISPWIITLEALAPFRSRHERDEDRAQPLPYLASTRNSEQGSIDIELEVLIQSELMSRENTDPERLSLGNFNDSYWTIGQMLTHHTLNGCNLRPGDLFGSGTMSGTGPGTQGALIEITVGGSEPITLANGETRTFLEDGDTIILKARCSRPGATPIGFGEARGTVEPSRGERQP